MEEKYKIKRKVFIEEEVGYKKYIAISIKELRLRHKMSQEDFGIKLGLSRMSVVNIEKGNQQLSIKNLSIICKEFNVGSKSILPF